MKISSPLRPRVVFLNGPPRSGKDAIGRIMQEVCPHISLRKFAQPLIDVMQRTFGVSCVDGEDKSKSEAKLFGRGRRETAIALSEDFFKPMFGEDVFGSIALREVLSISPIDTVVFTDSGFAAEAQPIIDHCLSTSIEMVTISRPDTDFSNDSRGYWRHDKVKANRIANNGSIEDLEQQVYALMESWRL